jgi:hypothetical protein
VNCENFQRQRIDCCGLWVSYKDYITDLENKIADIKANCDLAIEGREVKIKELENENKKLESDFRICEKNADTYYDQLSKAKEIIKELMSFSVQLCDCRHTVDFEKTREQAEQFLKEIEK